MRRKKKVEQEDTGAGNLEMITMFDNTIEVRKQFVERAEKYLDQETQRLNDAIKKKQDYLESLKK
ncbi:hypothetical protein [Glutamicibacter sp.]|uniref:hypothetical protein n=1 Tax=Glutamicibacter sp. TaxID=1931995 RepID=UPI002B468E89|nr:hypothetical protein [Glutamicibacter sp.]HJX79176.1 hypothetical protein [Glutamicibacter sp.]